MAEITDEQRMFVRSLRELANEEFEAKAFEWGSGIPWENAELLADRGFLGVNFDEAYGGGGMSEFEVILMIEEVGRVCPDTSEFLITQQLVSPRAIAMFGTEEAKERYLPPVIDGESYVAIAMSEPGGGSDLKSMTTEVEERDGELYLSGEKIWVSDVPDADAAVVWTKFPEGLGTVVMDFDAPGVEIANHFTNMAGNVQTQFYMEDVHIPEEHVLTRGREGFKEQLKALNWERLASAAQANAMAMSAVDKALEYAGDREQFGRPIGDFQGIEWKLADMAKRLEASRALTFKAAEKAVERGRVPDPLDTHIAKLYACEMAERVISEALQIHGANGYQQGHPLEYLYRFARGYRIAGGTDEIMKNTIGPMLKREGVRPWVE